MKISYWRGLSLFAFFAMFLFCSCEKKAQPSVAGEDGAEDELSERLVRCRSSVDSLPLEVKLCFPEDYDFSHPRPLIVVLPEMELPGKWRAGQALVARLANARPNGCPAWLLHEDFRNAMDYLCDNFPVMKNQIYLAANGIDGCRFACMNAPRFAGIYLQLDEKIYDKWEELPLKNLLNVPLFLQNDNFSPVAMELQQRLQRAGARYLNAPEFLLASTPSDGIVQAFAWLSAQKPSREKIVWEGSRAMPRESWWIRSDSIGEGGQMGTITAKYDRGSRRIYIYTKGMDALSVDTGWEGFEGPQPIDVEIDGCIFAIPCSKGWTRIAKDADGLWDVASLKPNAALRTDCRMHGLRAVMTRRVLLVHGSVNGERADAWKAAAMDFADAWQNLTACRPDVCADSEISQEMLDGCNLILFGSPADNSLTEALLEDDASFLRRLYDCLEGDSRTDEDLTCVTLFPDGTFSKGGIAAIVLANDAACIPNSWNAMLETTEADFVFKGKFGSVHGYLSEDWEIEE